MDIGGGVQMLPTVKLGWTHDYTDGPIPITSTLGGVAFTSATARPSADGASVGVDLTFVRGDRVRLGLEYQGDLRGDFQSHTGAVKVSWKFQLAACCRLSRDRLRPDRPDQGDFD